MSKRQVFYLCFIVIVSACSTTPLATPHPTLDPDTPAGRGAALFSGKGRCATCHSLVPDRVIVGPSLANIGTIAAERQPGLSAAEYLEEAIVRPDRFKAPGFESLQMDVSLAKTLTIDEIADLVAFMLTLK